MIKSNYICKCFGNYLRLILTAESNSDERRGLMFLFSVHYIENKLHSIFAAHDVHKDIRDEVKHEKLNKYFGFSLLSRDGIKNIKRNMRVKK